MNDMPRKGPAQRRDLMPDPIYRSVLVTQIVNKVMLHGKRSLAERIVYDAMKIVEEKTGSEPIATLKRADRQHQAAARGQEPPRRWRHLPGAGRGARPAGRPPWRSAGSSTSAAPAARRRWPQCLAGELMDAANGLGAAIKRRDDMQKMAERNKAFAHYRW